MLIFVGLFGVLLAKKLSTLEEFYRMYYLPSMATEDDYFRNQFWLQIALKSPFAIPMHALVVPKSEAQYRKYKHLMRMHLNYLLTKNAIYLAARFDKHRLVFHDKPVKEEILRSLGYARYHYEVAGLYWQEALKHYAAARRLRRRVPLEFLNQMVFRIHKKELDYDRVIRRKLKQLRKKIEFYENL